MDDNIAFVFLLRNTMLPRYAASCPFACVYAIYVAVKSRCSVKTDKHHRITQTMLNISSGTLVF